MATIPFTDIGKSVNDLLGKDYPAGAVKLEVKTTTPNGVNFTVTGAKDNKTGVINGELKTKYTDKKNGITFTEAWTTANLLSGEVELANTLAKGLKLAVNASLLPAVGQKNAKVTAEYKQANFNTRANLDLFKGPTFAGDAVVGHDGFLVGGDVAYNILDGRVTRYNAAAGYAAPDYALALHAGQSFSVFSGSYYHRVNAAVEAGGKAVWDSKANNQAVSIEVGTKYNLDRDTYVKAKIDNGGRLGLGYTQTLRPGVKVSLAGLFDTARINENAHKIGLSLVLESN